MTKREQLSLTSAQGSSKSSRSSIYELGRGWAFSLPSVTGLPCHLGSLTSPLRAICEMCVRAQHVLCPPFVLSIFYSLPPSLLREIDNVSGKCFELLGDTRSINTSCYHGYHGNAHRELSSSPVLVEGNCGLLVLLVAKQSRVLQGCVARWGVGMGLGAELDCHSTLLHVTRQKLCSCF